MSHPADDAPAELAEPAEAAAQPADGSGRLRRLARKVAIDPEPLRTPSFRWLWLGQAVTVFGTHMTRVAIPFQVYEITERSLYVGLTGIVILVPLILFGLYGGAISDAMDRRVLLLVSGVALGLISLALWVQALAPGEGSLAVLWTLAAVQSAFAAVNSPTRGAVIPRLLPARQMPAANTWNQLAFNGGGLLGPVVGGVVIAEVGLAWTYFIDATTFAVALAMLVRLPPLPPLADATSGRGLRSVAEGLRFLAGRRVLWMTFVVDINAMVFGFPLALFPELADTKYGGASALGWLYAAPAMGAVVVALVSGWLGQVNRQGLAVLVSVAVWGVAIGLFGFAGSLPVAVLLLALAGAADMVSAVFRSSILQLAAPDEMRGRLQGVFIVVVSGGPRLGDMRAGGMAAVSSPTASLVSGGALCVLGVGLLAAAVPVFARYDARRPTP